MQKLADICKTKGVLVLTGIFSETKYGWYIRSKIQTSILILTSFTQGREEGVGGGGGNLTPHSPPQNKPIESSPRLGFTA